MFLFLLYKFGQFLAIILPLRFSYWLARRLSDLQLFFNPKDLRIIKANLRLVLEKKCGTFSEKELTRTAREALYSFSEYLVEFFRFVRLDDKFFSAQLEIIGRENIDQALKLKKGVLTVTGHLGNWELGGAILAELGYPTNVVAWAHRSPWVNRFFLGEREKKSIKVIPLGFAIRRVFSALANNEAVAMVGDVDFLNIEEGIRVDFFGRPAFMPKGPAAISLKSGAPIVVGATFRSAPGKFKLILKPAIDPRPWQERPDAVYALTKRVLADLEALIMQCPAQWFMVNDIWGFLK